MEGCALGENGCLRPRNRKTVDQSRQDRGRETRTPVLDGGGAFTDVEVSYPLDLATQMLEYSAHYGMADEDRRVLASRTA